LFLGRQDELSVREACLHMVADAGVSPGAAVARFATA
jgi:hypothetical protein